MSPLREQFDIEADAIPALGDIDAALAQVAKEHRTWRRVGLAAVAAVAAVALLVGVRPLLGSHNPAVGPTTTVTPTPTATASPLSVGDPVVRGDSAHHRSYVVFAVRNGTDQPVVLGGFGQESNGGDVGLTPGAASVNVQILTAKAGDQMVAAPAASRYSIANSVKNWFPTGPGTLNSGGSVALVLIVSSPCTIAPTPITGATTIQVSGAGLRQDTTQTLVDFHGPTPAWLTSALRDACPS